MPLNPAPVIPADAPQRNSIWRHFKGHICTVMGVFVHTETGELLVGYIALDQFWARPLSMWIDNHSSGVKRFEYLGF